MMSTHQEIVLDLTQFDDLQYRFTIANLGGEGEGSYYFVVDIDAGEGAKGRNISNSDRYHDIFSAYINLLIFVEDKFNQLYEGNSPKIFELIRQRQEFHNTLYNCIKENCPAFYAKANEIDRDSCLFILYNRHIPYRLIIEECIADKNRINRPIISYIEHNYEKKQLTSIISYIISGEMKAIRERKTYSREIESSSFYNALIETDREKLSTVYGIDKTYRDGCEPILKQLTLEGIPTKREIITNLGKIVITSDNDLICLENRFGDKSTTYEIGKNKLNDPFAAIMAIYLRYRIYQTMFYFTKED
jgi:hypothetical protein